MSLNPKYITAPSLQQYFVDRNTGLPLVGGKVYFYRDTNRTEYKSVFEIQGNSANYSYSPLPNPITLSAVGTVQDNLGFDILPYYFPYDENDDLDLYYIRVYSSTGEFQFDRQAWPNPNVGGGDIGSDGLINYIPNGQFLAHTALPDNALVGGTNILAQGGFTFELPSTLPGPIQSVNTAEFLIEGFTDIPAQSPRYVLQIQCSTFNNLDSIKKLRIKFKDVNKFSTKPGLYTFAFAANSTGANIPANISIYKYFGTDGSPPSDTVQENFTITPAESSALYQFTINFGLNNGENIDLIANNDFVAVDINLPVGVAFTVQFADFVLAPGEVEVLNFPIQTDAAMLALGVMGWVETPNVDGMSLYLPPILTKEGMIWDFSQIGDIGMSVFPIDDPKSVITIDNKMPCDGATYISSEFSLNGIPYQRLSDKLFISGTGINDAPIYGTGPDFVIGLIPFSGVNNDTFRITWNTAGTGSPQAADGPTGFSTGFTFSPMYIYQSSTTGTAPIAIIASNTGTEQNLLVFTQDRTNAINFTNFADGTPATGFTFTYESDVSPPDSLSTFQGGCILLTCVSGSALLNGTGTGRNFTFQITSGSLYTVWFNVDGLNTAPGGANLIQINITSLYTAGDVASVVREALMGLQSTNILISALPILAPTSNISPYFTFSSNPGALRNFYIWFQIDGVGIDPAPVGLTGLKVLLSSTFSLVNARDAIRAVINRYQFQAPDFSGMFFRNADPNSVWDLDAVNRWSYTSNIGGPMQGTYEFSQFLSHYHTPITGPFVEQAGSGTGLGPGGSVTIATNSATRTTGGSETRPVNAYIYSFIRY